MKAYYNEYDKKTAAWLRELIRDGLITDGDVDERSICDVCPDDLLGYTQCHFFAGIGGWALALRLAGWPDDEPVWTGSCPCQPFSSAGKLKGRDDHRHLWPFWFRLIRERHPSRIFGEQVANAIGGGWLDDVQQDLESEDYAVGKAVLPGNAFGADHERKRLFILANSSRQGRTGLEHHGRSVPRICKSEISLTNDHFAQARSVMGGGGTHVLPSHGLSPIMVKRAIRGFGNAIIPEVAAQFIIASVEAINDIAETR